MKSSIRSIRSLLLLSVLAALAVGCSPYWYKSPEKFTVRNTRFNKVEIRYQASEEAPRIRCEMKNNGYIQVLEGHSVTVGDDFNIEYDKPTFSDVRKYTYSMSPEMFRETLQVLVNAGLLEDNPADEDDPIYPKVLVCADINSSRIEKFTADPELIATIRMFLSQFKMSGTLQ